MALKEDLQKLMNYESPRDKARMATSGTGHQCLNDADGNCVYCRENMESLPTSEPVAVDFNKLAADIEDECCTHDSKSGLDSFDLGHCARMLRTAWEQPQYTFCSNCDKEIESVEFECPHCGKPGTLGVTHPIPTGEPTYHHKCLMEIGEVIKKYDLAAYYPDYHEFAYHIEQAVKAHPHTADGLREAGKQVDVAIDALGRISPTDRTNARAQCATALVSLKAVLSPTKERTI